MKNRFLQIAVLLFCTLAMVASANAACVTVDGNLAATSEQALDKAIRYATQNDIESLIKLVDAGLVIMIKGGNIAYVEDSNFGKVKILIKGTALPVWTVQEAIRCK